MFDSNDLRPGQPFPFPFQMGDGVVVQPSFTLVDMVKASMQAVATSIQTDPRFKDGLLGDMRKKYLAVLRWLHGVACVANNEALCADVAKIAASFSLTEELGTGPFEIRPGLTIEAKREVKIPAFVAALNSGGSAFLVQVMVRGASVFFCNDDMASQFINAAEAEEEHSGTKDDPGSVMRKIVSQRDRPAYLRAAARLLVHLPQLASETSFMAHIMSREGNKVLCLVQMRASFSANGENVVMGTKLIPVPEPRPGTAAGEGASGGPQTLPNMPQFMMPFPLGAPAGSQPGGAPGGFPNLPYNPAMPWPWPGGLLPGGADKAAAALKNAASSSSSSTGGGKEDEDDETSQARKRSEANWETRRKTNKKSRKDDEEGGEGNESAQKEGGGKGDESYEEQQKNVRRRQLEKQQMEQVQLHYFQQMQLQHQQQLMASMGVPFGTGSTGGGSGGGVLPASGFNTATGTPQQVSLSHISSENNASSSSQGQGEAQVTSSSETNESSTDKPPVTIDV
jgi:hypothetical protein